MVRHAFVMRVNPDALEEYARRHNPIWPELAETLTAHGVHNYSIFLDRASARLFAYVELESWERWEAIARTEVCQRWWRHMADVMPANPDGSPVAETLEGVFHLD